MKRPLKHYIRECGARNKLRECTAVYSVTNSQGFVPSTDYFSKEVYSKDLTNYKIVKRGMIAYNPSRVNVGSLAVQNAEEQVIVSPLYVVISVDETQLLPEYLCYFLHSDIGLKEIAAHTAGSVRDSLKFSALQNIEITIRSVEEQRFIIRILQKVEALINKRRQTLNKLDDLVKSQFIEMFGNPEFNTHGLPLYKLGDLCNVGSSKRVYQDEQSTEGIPFLRISDLCNKIDGNENSCELFIPEKVYASLKVAGLVPVAGDILVTARGTLGRCYIIKESDRFYFQDGMITWLSELNEKVTSLYISHLFDSDGMKKQITSLQAGSTVAYLSIAMTKKLNIMLPPIEQQNEFARFVEQTDKSKFRIKQNLEKLEILYKSLLQEYFG